MAGKLRADLVPAGEVMRKARPVVAESAQIDDPRNAGLSGDRGKRAGRPKVALSEASLAAAHGMSEVIGGIDALECGAQAGGIEEVRPHHLYAGKAFNQQPPVPPG